jgi:beta-galactosidase
MTRINDNWEFHKGELKASVVAKWEKIRLPHSWNIDDVVDDEPGYYRGPAWYRRSIRVLPADRHKQFYIRFEGANQVAEVFVNGHSVGKHTGGYSAFQYPISQYLQFDSAKNEVQVRVDNSHDTLIAPLSADFTFFGGLYRDAWLISTDATQFDLDNHGSPGIFISTPSVSAEKAEVVIKGSVKNRQSKAIEVIIHISITDQSGKLAAEIKESEMIGPGEKKMFRQNLPPIAKPRLWSPTNPYLYNVRSTIVDKASQQVLDVVEQKTGFRWFHFDANKGFFLNGKSMKLLGASRHQDRPGMGNAVPDKLAYEDLVLLKKMGANFLRVAHYPQDPSIMDACDKLGLLASVEIPVVNEISEAERFYSNCDTMLVEMIRQNYNHPSVIMWCYMNEVLLRPHFTNDKERQKVYFSNVTRLAKRLDSLCRLEDTARYTMIAHHGDFDRYHSNELTKIPMVVGWNLYSGWYGGTLENFSAFLDKHHQVLPGKPVIVSEYGADADPRIRSLQPVRFDKSIEYAMRFHQYYYQEIARRDFVAGAMIWNLADFNSETREETMPHINNKGMLMWGRQPKDLYYLYQALWSKEPILKISSTHWASRTGSADSASNTCYQPLQVASNLDSVELIFNGRSRGWKKSSQGICEWMVPFINKINRVEAIGYQQGKKYLDVSVIDFRLQPYSFTDKKIPFESINVLLGANRYFNSEERQVWQPAQPYRPGSWGYTGGQPYKMPNNNRLPYGSDKNIANTTWDPVYQTQQVGIKGFRFDLPDGRYELVLHFAELEGAISKSLIYNLSGQTDKEQTIRRRFNVFVNDSLLLENLNLPEMGAARPFVKKCNVSVTGGGGIVIRFQSIEGEPVLNAIQLRKFKDTR